MAWLSRRPLVSLVTDAARLTAATGGRVRLDEQVAAAVAAGVDLIQIRESGWDRSLVELVTRCVALAGTECAVLVNDRVDVALASGAAGVHLPARSVRASMIRRHVAPEFVLGRSVHSADEAARVEADGGVDYLTMGTVYPSESKPDGVTCGVSGLAETTRTVALPVLAIGGIVVDRTEDIFAAGAAGIAAVGLFQDVDSGDGWQGGMSRAVDAVRRRYAAFREDVASGVVPAPSGGTRDGCYEQHG